MECETSNERIAVRHGAVLKNLKSLQKFQVGSEDIHRDLVLLRCVGAVDNMGSNGAQLLCSPCEFHEVSLLCGFACAAMSANDIFTRT